MSTGQIFLAVGAILLLMNVTTSLNRSYVMAITETISHQTDLEAIQFGQALSENLFSAGRDYNTLTQVFGTLDDVTIPNRRIEFVTAFGDTLYAQIILSNETTLMYNVTGRTANIQVFTKENSEYVMRTQNTVTLNQR
jgi:hypothetical protein